jgi:cation diffusion facilitator CzcD-associated flavoprotein CzcO
VTARVIIIGAGFGGIAAAIELKRGGHDAVLLLEKGDEVGGVWRDNTYPGAACDVPSPFYSYSFEPHPGWPRRYAGQPQILDYLIKVTDKYDVRRHVRFGAEVVACSWDDASRKWTVRLASGDELECDVLIPALGQLSRPSYPQINGRETFSGPAFHSARWDHDVNLDGKKVAVIGTGASAIQFVPAIQPLVASLTIFQRTPPYIVPRWDAEYGPRHQTLFRRVPQVQAGERLGWFAYLEVATTAFVYSSLLARAFTALARRHTRRQTAAVPGLFEKVWPDYPVGCKRALLSDTYLPALTQRNVQLVTDPIDHIGASGIRTAEGWHEADVIIYGTGFAATDFLVPMDVTGRDGLSLEKAWAEGAHASFGLTVPGFPNLLIMYGPNTNTGGGSIVYFLETQARYIRAYVDQVASAGSALDLKPEVDAAFDAEIQRRLDDSVWTRCSSWYRAASGRITANWPGLSAEYRRRARFRPDDYLAI